MKTKNIILLFVVLVVTTLFSCKDYLDRPPYAVLTTDNFYKTPDQLLQGLTTAYNPLGFKEFEQNLMASGDIVTDDAEKGGSDPNDQADIYALSRFRAVPTNGYCSDLWNYSYSGIYQCNLVMQKAPDVESKDPALVKRIVGEAKFLRGLYFFHLASVFGGVPLVTTPLTPAELTLERASSDATWDQIEKDFSEAASALPLKSEYPATDLGRATSGAAYSMLAKAYLMRQKYTEAETALANVVSSNEYTLVDDYGKIFTKPYENGSESVFEIQHQNTNSGWIDQTEGTWLPVFCQSRLNGGYGFDCPTEDLKHEFEPGDPRLIYTLTFTGDVLTGGTDALNNSESPTLYHNRKLALGMSERADNFWDQGYNIRFLRYADVLLLYAEVLNENNKSTEALTYLNKVRDRARATNPVDPRRTYQVVNITVELPVITTTSKDELRLKIWHERRVELAMEYVRRFDLVRQKRYGSVMRAYATAYNNDKGNTFDDAIHYLWPIPINEINTSYHKIIQNPGY
jgi:starch-binding outer membrane protein, SusD/RagB family